MQLDKGKIAVIRTDTLYGIIAKVNDQEAIEKVYTVKHRDPSKACITLVSDKKDIGQYGDEVERVSSEFPNQAITVLVPRTIEPEFLTRGKNMVSYRIPKDQRVLDILKQTGPVIAPSANPEGLAPARTIAQAQGYFGEAVDIYVDDGEVDENVSASMILILKEDGSLEQIR